MINYVSTVLINDETPFADDVVLDCRNCELFYVRDTRRDHSVPFRVQDLVNDALREFKVSFIVGPVPYGIEFLFVASYQRYGHKCKGHVGGRHWTQSDLVTCPYPAVFVIFCTIFKHRPKPVFLLMTDVNLKRCP